MSSTQFNFEFLGFKGKIFFDTKNKPTEDGQFQLLKPTSGSAGNGSIENITWNGNTLTGKLSGSMAYMVGDTPTNVNGFEGTCVLTFNDDLTSFTGKYSDAPTQAAFKKISFERSVSGNSITIHPTYYPYYLSGATAATSKVQLPGTTTAATNKRVTLMRFVYGTTVNSGWYRAIPTKETDDFQLIEFYYDQTAHTIYLYKLNKEFMDLSTEEEQYKILAGGTLKSGYTPLIRAFSVSDMIGPDYLNPLPDNIAFDQILPLVFFEIFQRFPSDIYGVRYSGHGSPASMFGIYTWGYHQRRILRAINTMLGRKIDFLDWNSNCNTGSIRNILNQYQYTDYIIAADLERTDVTTYGFGLPNDPLKRKFDKRKYITSPRAKYPDYFAGDADVPTALKAHMDYLHEFWSEGGFVYAQQMENVTLFDASKFEALWDLIKGIVNDDNATLADLRACTYWEGMVPWENVPTPAPAPATKMQDEYRHIDVKLYIQNNVPSAITQWNDFVSYQVSTEDYLDWGDSKYADYTAEARGFPKGLSFPNGLAFHRYGVTAKTNSGYYPWDNSVYLNPVVFDANDYV